MNPVNPFPAVEILASRYNPPPLATGCISTMEASEAV
jgi:hypothetical protein